MTKAEETPQENEQKVDPTWADDFPSDELTIPYSKDEVEEKKEETNDEDEEEKPQEEEVPQAQEVESLITFEDPGEFTPNDYSFKQVIDGKEYVISSSEDIDKIDEEDMAKLSAKEITTLLRKANQADAKLEKDRESYDMRKENYDNQVRDQKERDEQIETFAAEFDYLVSKGLIPKVPSNLANADWSDPKVAEAEGVKEQREILDYMEKENDQRIKLGLKPLTSIIDAYNSFQLEKQSGDKEDKEQKAKEARKAAGARVSGTTNNNASSPVPRGIAVGRVNAFSRNTDWEN